MSDLQRRLDRLEATTEDKRSAAEYTDRELLQIAIPSYVGPMPDDDTLMKMLAEHGLAFSIEGSGGQTGKGA